MHWNELTKAPASGTDTQVGRDKKHLKHVIASRMESGGTGPVELLQAEWVTEMSLKSLHPSKNTDEGSAVKLVRGQNTVDIEPSGEEGVAGKKLDWLKF